MTTAAGTELAAVACSYADRGWQVFPVRGKRPLTPHGLKAATTDPDQICTWWQRWPDAGIAIRTGRESGLYVLDVDGETGADSLHELEQRHGDLPATIEVLTGGGGRHIYFAHPGGGELRNTAGILGPRLDTRGGGGYVVAPPSPHPSGRRYEWSVDGHPDDVELAGPPAWLLQDPGPGHGKPATPPSAWRDLAMNGAKLGERNHRTAQLAGHLLARGVDPYVALALITAWDRINQPPLGSDEVRRVVDSIARAEARKVRA